MISLKSWQAVIEHVRDGSTVRAFLLPDFYHVTVMMSGVRVSISEYKDVTHSYDRYYLTTNQNHSITGRPITMAKTSC